MFTIPQKDKEKLYRKVKHQLVGEGIYELELNNNVFDSLFEVSIEEYEEVVYNWLNVQQWGDIVGKELNSTDFAFYLMTRTLEFEKGFTYAYSKEQGLGTNAPWELKEDYINLSAHTQNYVIPAGREVESVLWFTQPSVDQGRFAAANDAFGPGFQFGFVNGGRYGFPINHVYNIVQNTQDVSIRNRIYSHDLSYKITAGPNGTRILKLYPTPGGQYDLGRVGTWYELFNSGINPNLSQTRVYYYYYDDVETVDCLNNNINVVTLPSDTPFDGIEWNKINRPARNWIRKMLLAQAKMTLSNIRGTYSGDIPVEGAPLKMDYQKLAAEGTQEKEQLFTQLREMLAEMAWDKIMEKRASIAKNTNEVMKYVPNKTIIG